MGIKRDIFYDSAFCLAFCWGDGKNPVSTTQRSEQTSEGGGDRSLELHALVGDRMVEAEQESVEAEPVERVVAIAVFHIAADGMPHVGGVDTDLVLAPGLQLELHERVLGGTCERMEMRHRILTAIVDRR